MVHSENARETSSIFLLSICCLRRRRIESKKGGEADGAADWKADAHANRHPMRTHIHIRVMRMVGRQRESMTIKRKRKEENCVDD